MCPMGYLELIMYEDSTLGLCIDLRGPDGNVFALLGAGDQLAKQLGTEDEWKSAVKAAAIMEGDYMTMVNLFKQFFPVITLVGLKEIEHAHMEED